MAKDIRSLSRYNESTEQTEIFYPATTTDAIAHPTKRKSLTNVISDIETHNGAYDISAANSDTTYANLSAALGADGANIPADLRKGGMSVKFVLSSDNKYVQYRLMADEWSTNTKDWAIADEGVYVENPEFVYVKMDAESKILWGIKADGSIYYGAGIPSQVKDYVEKKIADLSLDEYEDIVTFLGNLIEGDKTLQELLNDILATKVDKVEGKGLSTNDYTNDEKTVVNTQELVKNPEFMEIETDNSDKILGGRRTNGRKFDNVGFDTPDINLKGVEIKAEDDIEERIELEIDANNKVLSYRKKDGTKVEELLQVNDLKVSDKGKEQIKDYAGTGEFSKLPSYYVPYIKEKVLEINSIKDESGINGDSFVFFSDYHRPNNEKHSAELIKYILNNTGTRMVVYGGDILNEDITLEAGLKDIFGFKNDFIETWSRIYPIIGNHDYNSIAYILGHTDDSSICLNNSQVYGKLMKDKEEKLTLIDSLGDYYIDNKAQKIRYFFFGCNDNTYLKPEAVGNIIHEFEQVPDDYKIILFSHLSLSGNGNGVSTWSHFRPIVKAFGAINERNANFSYTLKFDDSVGGETITFTADFSNSKATAFCIIGGHLHDDIDLGYTHSTTSGFIFPPVHIICTTTDAWLSSQQFATTYKRKRQSVSSQAFDVVHIDFESGIIYMKRIGGGYDRIYHQQVVDVAVGSSVSVTPILSGSFTWTTSKSTIASVSNGVVTGVASGVAFITGTKSTGEREIFIVNVNS